MGFHTTTDNAAAVRDATVVLVAVRPKQMNDALGQIAPALDPGRHVLISTATDVRDRLRDPSGSREENGPQEMVRSLV